MKLNYFFFIILIIVSINTTSQERKICNDTINIKYQNNKLGKYIGCLNYEGNKDGYGTLYSPDGYIYEGDFKNNKREGQGKLIYPDGYVYTGGFKNNKKEGKGKLVYPNGNGSYIGEFQNNMFNGAGIETIKDKNYKKVSEGEFVNSILFNGEKTLYLSSGKKQIYEIKEAQPVSISQYNNGNLEFSEKGEFFPNNSLNTGTQKQFIDNYIITNLSFLGSSIDRNNN